APGEVRKSERAVGMIGIIPAQRAENALGVLERALGARAVRIQEAPEIHVSVRIPLPHMAAPQILQQWDLLRIPRAPRMHFDRLATELQIEHQAEQSAGRYTQPRGPSRGRPPLWR